LHGDDGGFGLSDKRGGFPAEVAFPILPARMKQRDEFPRQQPGQIRAFGPVTFRTGETKIIGIVGSAVLPGDDVFDVKSLVLVLFLM